MTVIPDYPTSAIFSRVKMPNTAYHIIKMIDGRVYHYGIPRERELIDQFNTLHYGLIDRGYTATRTNYGYMYNMGDSTAYMIVFTNVFM